nr:FtsX-like permease family protein [uncultured Eisenbergiella sp.]
MLKNLNAGIIRRLAANSLKSDKKRNLFLIITIAFSACLMLTLSLKILGENTKLNKYMRGRYQTVFSDLPEKDIRNLQKQPEVEASGVKKNLYTARIRDYTVDVEYSDPSAASLLTYGKVLGSWPEKEKEIVVEEAYLKHLGLPVEPGQKVTVDLGEGSEREYMVSGILLGDNETRVYRIVVSKDYVNSVYGENTGYDINIRLKDTEKDNMQTLKAKIQAFADANGVAENKVFYSSTYFSLGEDLPIEKVLAILFCCILIVIATSLVIYSLFYISVVGKIQEYGRLRVIGTTKKQIRRLVRKEGLFVSGIAVPIGLLLGCILGFLLVPDGWKWSITLLFVGVIAVITEAAVMISIRTPVKIASSVSPVEAVRISAVNENGRRKNRKRRKITPVSLALLNFSRNKRKAILTLTSLGFTGMLLMCVAAYLNSVDDDAMSRAAFGLGCVHLELQQSDARSDTSDDGLTDYYTKVQQENPLDEEMLQTVKQIDGVSDVLIFQGCKSDMIFPEMNDYARENPKELSFRNIGLTREQMEACSGYLMEGTMDYDTLVQNHGILIADSDNLIGRFYGYTAKLGDKIQIKTDRDTTVEFQVMGVLRGLTLGIDVPFFYMPEVCLPLLKTTVTNYNTHFMLVADQEKEEQIEEAIITQMEKWDSIEISFLSDLRRQMSLQMEQIKLPLYGLVGFIAVFGLLNLINTLLTNVVTRRREFGILQSVGMSGKQLSSMLKAECFLYVSGTLFLTLTVGTLAGWILCRIFDQLGTFGKLVFHFPVLPILVFAFLLLLIQMFFSFWAVGYCKKESLVQRIKTE